MIDFDTLRKQNGSFVGTGADFEDYKLWASQQVCSGCGAKASERPRDENGRCLDWWVTETECGHCPATGVRK